jgi:hypothetical protein
MPIKMRAGLDVVTNIAVLACCALLVWQFVVVPRRLASAPSGESPRASMDALKASYLGRQIALPTGGQAHRVNVVAFLSTVCSYCTASAPFYRRLQAQLANSGGAARLLVAFPQPKQEAEAYLLAQKLPADLFWAAPGIFQTYGRATPTLLVADATGKVTGAWIGRLSTEDEGKLLEQVRKACPECPASPSVGPDKETRYEVDSGQVALHNGGSGGAHVESGGQSRFLLR